MPKNYIQAIEGSTFDTSTITPEYQPINPDGLPVSCSILRLSNFSSLPIAVSFDGETDNDGILPNSYIQLPVQASALPNGNVAQFKKGTIVYVASPTTAVGEVILAAYYQGE